jgi:large subunit ribosomal protein L1
VAKAIEELKKGKISFKNDDTANLHCLIGKVSFSTEKLAENYSTLIDTVRKAKPSSAKGSYIKGISICSSMSRGVKVVIS